MAAFLLAPARCLGDASDVQLPRVIFLHGPVASGKLTIARELARLTGFMLFHNHLPVDLLLALFPFGSPPFVELRERIWLDAMERAVASGIWLIFTFNPERTVSPGFPDALNDRITAAGGAVSFVEIACSDAEIERRIESDSRREHCKLSSMAEYRSLKADGAFEYSAITSAYRVDSSAALPDDAARQITQALGLTVIAGPA